MRSAVGTGLAYYILEFGDVGGSAVKEQMHQLRKHEPESDESDRKVSGLHMVLPTTRKRQNSILSASTKIGCLER